MQLTAELPPQSFTIKALNEWLMRFAEHKANAFYVESGSSLLPVSL